MIIEATTGAYEEGQRDINDHGPTPAHAHAHSLAPCYQGPFPRILRSSWLLHYLCRHLSTL